MAYPTDASLYAYTTLADVEAFTGIDYSGVDSVAFSDTNVNKTIAIAERMVNAFLGITDSTAASTITDGITMATIILSAKWMRNKMNELGYGTEGLKPNENDLVNMNERAILAFFLSNDESTGIDNIPMNGPNLYYGIYGSYY